MLYSQLFETLYWKGEQQLAAGGTESLKYPVRCLMDEFANVGTVPDFPSRLATMRKYNISATIALQDIAQLEEMYDKGWRTLAGNCSSYVFLGTQQPDTLKFFSEMLGKETIRIKSDSIANGDTKGNSNSSYQWTGREVMTTEEMSRMDENHCLVYTQGKRPVYDEKYNMKKHPRYSQTADADRENAFLYASMAVYDNSNNAGLRTLLKARQEAVRCVCISIRDNGAGMSDAEQAGVFTRYYRGTSTREKPEGSGLGLAIAKQIVTLHSGDITVRSKLGEGTEFLVCLPEKFHLKSCSAE